MTVRGKRAELNLLEDYCDLREEEKHMYQIIDKRGTGKTSRLMLIAKETDATIVCASPSAFYKKAEAYGITGLKFISYDDFWRGVLGPYEKFLIDELECCLRHYNKNIFGYDLSLED